MTTFVYSRSGTPLPLRGDEIPSASCAAGTQACYLSDDGETDSRRFTEVLGVIASGDTLIVGRLEDLGNDAQEIKTTIELLRARSVRIFVRQIGEAALAAVAGRLVLNTLDALAEIEHHAASDAAVAEVFDMGRKRAKVGGPLRSAIITDYSLGESIVSLARRYKLPRSTIAKLVSPSRHDEPTFPPAFRG